MAQLHKRFHDDEVKDLFRRYVAREIKRKYVQQILGIGKSHFFALLNEYRRDSDTFSIQYERAHKSRSIDHAIETTPRTSSRTS